MNKKLKLVSISVLFACSSVFALGVAPFFRTVDSRTSNQNMNSSNFSDYSLNDSILGNIHSSVWNGASPKVLIDETSDVMAALLPNPKNAKINDLYLWGDNSTGAIFSKPTSDKVWHPEKVDIDPNSETESVIDYQYSFNSGISYAVVEDKGITNVYTWRKYKEFSDIIDLSSSTLDFDIEYFNSQICNNYNLYDYLYSSKDKKKKLLKDLSTPKIANKFNNYQITDIEILYTVIFAVGREKTESKDRSNIYAIGLDLYGYSGTAEIQYPLNIIDQPKKINLENNDVIYFDTSTTNAFAVTTSPSRKYKNTYVWGFNEVGQIKVDNQNKIPVLKPVKYNNVFDYDPDSNSVLSVITATNLFGVIKRTENNKNQLYTWGSGGNASVLGYEDDSNQPYKPKVVEKFKDYNVIDVAISKEYGTNGKKRSSNHAAAIVEDANKKRHVFVWGSNSSSLCLGMTGIFDNYSIKEVNTPFFKNPDLIPLDIEFSQTTGTLLAKEGDYLNIYTWGNGFKGQLGNGVEIPENPNKPNKAKHLSTIIKTTTALSFVIDVTSQNLFGFQIMDKLRSDKDFLKNHIRYEGSVNPYGSTTEYKLLLDSASYDSKTRTAKVPYMLKNFYDNDVKPNISNDFVSVGKEITISDFKVLPEVDFENPKITTAVVDAKNRKSVGLSEYYYAHMATYDDLSKFIEIDKLIWNLFKGIWSYGDYKQTIEVDKEVPITVNNKNRTIGFGIIITGYADGIRWSNSSKKFNMSIELKSSKYTGIVPNDLRINTQVKDKLWVHEINGNPELIPSNLFYITGNTNEKPSYEITSAIASPNIKNSNPNEVKLTVNVKNFYETIYADEQTTTNYETNTKTVVDYKFLSSKDFTFNLLFNAAQQTEIPETIDVKDNKTYSNIYPFQMIDNESLIKTTFTNNIVSNNSYSSLKIGVDDIEIIDITNIDNKEGSAVVNFKIKNNKFFQNNNDNISMPISEKTVSVKIIGLQKIEKKTDATLTGTNYQKYSLFDFNYKNVDLKDFTFTGFGKNNELFDVLYPTKKDLINEKNISIDNIQGTTATLKLSFPKYFDKDGNYIDVYKDKTKLKMVKEFSLVNMIALPKALVQENEFMSNVFTSANDISKIIKNKGIMQLTNQDYFKFDIVECKIVSATAVDVYYSIYTEQRTEPFFIEIPVRIDGFKNIMDGIRVKPEKSFKGFQMQNVFNFIEFSSEFLLQLGIQYNQLNNKIEIIKKLDKIQMTFEPSSDVSTLVVMIGDVPIGKLKSTYDLQMSSDSSVLSTAEWLGIAVGILLFFVIVIPVIIVPNVRRY